MQTERDTDNEKQTKYFIEENMMKGFTEEELDFKCVIEEESKKH